MKRLCLALMFVFLLGSVAFAAIATDDIAVHTDFAQATGVRVDASGDLVPVTDSTNDLGASGEEFAEVHADAIIMGSNYKYSYMPISADSDAGNGGAILADKFTIGGIAVDLTATGLSGVEETGAAEGYVTLDAATDNMTWYMVLPETFVDGGSASDLLISFDMSEAAAAAGTDSYELYIYEDGSETAVMVDEDLSMNATTRAWVDSSGMGDNASISGANKVLIVKIETQGADDDCQVYGARLKYKAGIDVV